MSHNISEFCIGEVRRGEASPPCPYCLLDILNIVQRKMNDRGTLRCLMESAPKMLCHCTLRERTCSPLPPIRRPCLSSQKFNVRVPTKSNVAS